MALYINFSDIDFNCPYCDKVYFDLNDKYLNRVNKNKRAYTKIKCDCKKTFGMTYNYMGNAVSFKI